GCVLSAPSRTTRKGTPLKSRCRTAFPFRALCWPTISRAPIGASAAASTLPPRRLKSLMRYAPNSSRSLACDFMNFLAIETSCDETSVAIFTDDLRILANVVASQTDLHARFGGVVPEVAARAHLQRL